MRASFSSIWRLSAAILAGAYLLLALAFALRHGNSMEHPFAIARLGVGAAAVAGVWCLWGFFDPKARLNGRKKLASAAVLLGTGMMLISMVGMLLHMSDVEVPAFDALVQPAGIATYLAWAAALLAMPAKRMATRNKLPLLLDVVLIVTAISAAGWFFLIAPQVRLDGFRFAVWLTLAYPLANLVSIASIVAAIYLGGPFKWARGLLMAGIALNVAGDVTQYVFVLNRAPSPSAYIHWMWIVSTLCAGLAALELRKDPDAASPPEVPMSEPLGMTRAVVPIIFLAMLVTLALWGNSVRPNSNDVVGLNAGCMVAIFCCLGRILFLIKDNADLGVSLSQVNQSLDAQVRERTQQLSEAIEDVQSQRLFLRSVIDALPSYVLSVSADNRVLLANDMAERMFAAEESLEGTPYPGEDVRPLLVGGLTMHAEKSLQTLDGQERTFDVVKTPVPGKDGLPEQVLIVGNDISLRKAAEKALVDARVAAEQATRTKNDFLAKMSHELRTPMNGVIGNTELLLSEDLPHHHRELALNIRTSGESLLRMVNDVLDLARIDSGQSQLEEHPTCLVELCSEVISEHRSRAMAKGLSLRAEVRLEPQLRFATDGPKVRQILSHLLSNAIKFTSVGTVFVDVDLLRRNKDVCTIRFSVRDTGVGIPDESLGAIFEAFTQGDNTLARKYGGAGLGLALCRESVRLLGGAISVESKVGEGSSFFVDLPMRLQEDETAGGGARRSLSGLSVLVVEDNLVNQTILRKLLERLGCSVAVANNGREAVDWLPDHTCDLVLMDCQMPEMDGLEATRHIRQMPAGTCSVPIVAVTANSMPGDRERCLAAGMDDYVAKPFKLEALTATLERVTSYAHAA